MGLTVVGLGLLDITLWFALLKWGFNERLEDIECSVEHLVFIELAGTSGHELNLALGTDWSTIVFRKMYASCRLRSRPPQAAASACRATSSLYAPLRSISA